jgi:hypothetical protein
MAPRNMKSTVLVKKKKNKRQRQDDGRALTTPVRPPISGSAIVRKGVYPPRIESKGLSTFVRNTEQLTSPQTIGVGFGSARSLLTPGNVTWLSGIADCFNKFRWHFLKLIYIPTCPTTTQGQLAMALGYDVVDASPTLMIQTQQMYNSVTCPAWAGFDGCNDLNQYSTTRSPGSVSVQLDCTRLGGPSGDAFYRTISNLALGALSAAEQNIYVPAYIDVSTFGGPVAVNTIGTLFIEYIVEFIEPTVPILNV